VKGKIKAASTALVIMLAGTCAGYLCLCLLLLALASIGENVARIVFPDLFRQIQIDVERHYVDAPLWASSDFVSRAVGSPFVCLGATIIGWGIARLYALNVHLGRGFLIGMALLLYQAIIGALLFPSMRPSARPHLAFMIEAASMAVLYLTTCVIALYISLALVRRSAQYRRNRGQTTN